MRELIASIVCVLTASIIILLSGISASRQDQPVPAIQKTNDHKLIESPRPVSAELDDGQVIFEKQRCHTCHSFKRRGNDRSPLDGVVKQLSREELREWITGTGSAAPLLSPAIKRRKANYLKLSDAEMAALIRYLSSAETSANRVVNPLSGVSDAQLFAPFRKAPRSSHPQNADLQNLVPIEQEMQKHACVFRL